MADNVPKPGTVDPGKIAKPAARGMMIAMAVVAVLAMILIAFFLTHVARPAAEQRPAPAPLTTER